MNSRILAIGDPHIRTKEVEFTDMMLKEIVKIARIEKPDAIVVLGDTLHSNNNIDANPLSRAVRWLGKLSDIAPLILLIGNHDLKNNKVRIDKDKHPEHPFTALKRWKNTTVVDRPTLINVKGVRVCAVPYIPDGEYHDAIRGIKAEEVDVFFSHSMFYGVKYRLDEAPSTNADVWPAGYGLNVCGHNHEYQWVSDNLVFLGTPGQQDYGANKDKAIGIFEFWTEEDKIKYSLKRIPLMTIPIRGHYILQAEALDEILRLLEYLKGLQRPHLSKITLKGSTTLLRSIEKTGYYKELKAMKGVTMDPVPTDIGVETMAVETVALINDSIFDEKHINKSFISTVTEMFKTDPAMLSLIDELK